MKFPAPAAVLASAIIWVVQCDDEGPFKVDFPSSCSGRDVVWRLCPDLVTCGRCVPENCVFNDWTTWGGGDCTGLCARHRSIRRRNNECGDPCEGPLKQSKTCHTVCEGSEPVNCEVDDWSEWSKCSGTHTQRYRTRSVATLSARGGRPCSDPLEETRPCEGGEEDAEVSSWSDWEPCNAACDTGERVRTRKVTKIAMGGGTGFTGPLKEASPCVGLKPCTADADCKWGEWFEWSGCSCTCGGGMKTRDRHVAAPRRGNGKPCQPMDKQEVAPCNTKPCGKCVDGVWGKWSVWQGCSSTCGGGVTVRHRTVLHSANDCGEPVTGLTQEVMACNSEISCSDGGPDVDCEFNGWDDWSACTQKCNGVRHQSRTVKVHRKGSGAFCTGALRQVASCNAEADGCHPPKPVDCEMSEWSRWSDCANSCGSGQQHRDRHVVKEAQGDGKPCVESTKEMRPCMNKPCPIAYPPIPCIWGSWHEWGACTKCSGQRHRYRHIVTPAMYGGTACEPGASMETAPCPRTCHEHALCTWAEWESWSKCSATCGDGHQKRTRKLTLVSKEEHSEKFSVMGPQLQASLAPQSDRVQDVIVSFAAGCLTIVAVVGVARVFHATRRSCAQVRTTVNAAPAFRSTLIE